MSRLRKRSPPAILLHQIARRSPVGHVTCHRRLRARQIEAAGRVVRLRGSTASSDRDCGADDQHKRRPVQGCKCCHCDAAPSGRRAHIARLPCIRARQSRLPVSMRERSRGRPGHPAYCPPSNDDRFARIRVPRRCPINPSNNIDGFAPRVAVTARLVGFEGYKIDDISLNRENMRRSIF